MHCKYKYYYSVLNMQVEKDHATSGQTLRAALTKAEAAYPGFTYDFVTSLVKKAELSINMNEAILRLQGSLSDADCKLLYFSIDALVKFLYIIC